MTAMLETAMEEVVPVPAKAVSVKSIGTNGHIEKRTITTKESESQYDFVVVDSPEKWHEASSFKGRYELLLGNKKLSIPLSGISYLDWEQQEEMFSYPEKPEAPSANERVPRNEQEKYEEEIEAVRQKRKVFMFQNVTGMSIPGKDMEEKITWLNARGYDAVESFYSYVELHMTGLSSNRMLDAYNQESSLSIATPEIVELKNLEDWDVADKTQAIFRLCRPFDDFILEFHLRRMSHDFKSKIDRETKFPDPPKKPGKNPITGRTDIDYFTANLKDPRWLQACTTMRHKKTVMLFEATLPFEIPGADYKEKHTWISKRLIGDVHKLQEFITDELLDYKRQTDFFTSSLGR